MERPFPRRRLRGGQLRPLLLLREDDILRLEHGEPRGLVRRAPPPPRALPARSLPSGSTRWLTASHPRGVPLGVLKLPADARDLHVASAPLLRSLRVLIRAPEAPSRRLGESRAPRALLGHRVGAHDRRLKLANVEPLRDSFLGRGGATRPRTLAASPLVDRRRVRRRRSDPTRPPLPFRRRPRPIGFHQLHVVFVHEGDSRDRGHRGGSLGGRLGVRHRPQRKRDRGERAEDGEVRRDEPQQGGRRREHRGHRVAPKVRVGDEADGDGGAEEDERRGVARVLSLGHEPREPSRELGPHDSLRCGLLAGFDRLLLQELRSLVRRQALRQRPVLDELRQELVVLEPKLLGRRQQRLVRLAERLGLLSEQRRLALRRVPRREHPLPVTGHGAPLP